MVAPSRSRTTRDPFGVAASLDEWCCLLRAAKEIRDIDAEMMETMMEAEASGPVPSAAGEAAKLRSLTTLLRSLDIDPEAVRRGTPEAMRALEAACLQCTERDRCARELQAGTAPRTYRAFCPNASRISRLRRA